MRLIQQSVLALALLIGLAQAQPASPALELETDTVARGGSITAKTPPSPGSPVVELCPDSNACKDAMLLEAIPYAPIVW